MNETVKKQESKVKFYPIPTGARLTLETPESEMVSIEQLVSVAMHLQIDNPNQRVRYWIQVEG